MATESLRQKLLEKVQHAEIGGTILTLDRDEVQVLAALLAEREDMLAMAKALTDSHVQPPRRGGRKR